MVIGNAYINYYIMIVSLVVSLFITFIDYEKAFDCVDRDVLWKLLGHNGIPSEFINLIRNIYEVLSCKVIHNGQLTESYEV